ncbi:MAG: ABC transporter substrate-binding protein [Nitrososphaerales archaeon]|nr:ABC transporter substrate-binding protein [Nitrososphaerales archaeon]
MAKIRAIIIAVVIIVSIATVSAVYFITQPTKTKPPEPLYETTIGVIAAYYEASLPVLVAEAMGYFDAEGVKVNFLTFPGGADARKALVAGEVQFAAQGSIHGLIARGAGADVKIVAPIYDLSTIAMFVRKELKDVVKDVSDLKGRVIGCSRFGSLTWGMAVLYLKKAGLDPAKDVTFIEVGSDPIAVTAALTAGKIDAYPAFTPITFKWLKENVAYPLIEIWKPEVHLKWIGSTVSTETSLLTREDIIKKNPELVQKVVNALKKGLSYIKTRSSSEIADVLLRNPKTAEQFAGLPKEDVLGILDLLKPGYSDGVFTREGYMAMAGPLVEFKIVPKDIPFEECVDWRFAGLKGR